MKTAEENTEILWCEEHGCVFREMIRLGFEERVYEFYSYLCLKVLRLGDYNFSDQDIVDIILRADRAGKFKNILDNGFTGWLASVSLLISVYESHGAVFNYDNYSSAKECYQLLFE